MSEAFAQEKTSRLKQLRHDLDSQILEQEIRVDMYKEKLKAKKTEPTPKDKKKQDESKKVTSSSQ